MTCVFVVRMCMYVHSVGVCVRMCMYIYMYMHSVGVCFENVYLCAYCGVANMRFMFVCEYVYINVVSVYVYKRVCVNICIFLVVVCEY